MIYSDEKLELLKEGNLIHKLWLLTNAGTEKIAIEEQSQLADMILRIGKERKGIAGFPG